jgi:acyl carrier protein
MTHDETLEKISGYVRDELLGAESGVQIDERTPLLEWGVLNSMNTARLLTFIRETLGVPVPPSMITGKHFRDLRTITDLVLSLTASAA